MEFLETKINFLEESIRIYNNLLIESLVESVSGNPVLKQIKLDTALRYAFTVQELKKAVESLKKELKEELKKEEEV